jgi:hypothetical protein
MANLGPSEMEVLGRAMLRAEIDGDMTATERATQRLVDNGLISPQAKLFWDAGAITHDMDPTGKPVIINKLNGETFYPGGDPKASTNQPALNLPEPPSAELIQGAGIVAGLESTVGNIAGHINPEWAAEDMNRWKGQIEVIKNNVLQVPEITRLKSIVDSFTTLVTPKALENPINYGNRLLIFHDQLDTLEYAATVTANNARATEKARAEAEETLRYVDLNRNGLPSREDLEAQVNVERVKTGGTAGDRLSSEGVDSGLVRRGLERVGLGKPKDPASGPTQYTNDNEAIEAYKRGEIQIGDEVIINGVPRTVGKRGQ